jgi:crotonobetainyl-CoA:carnitine CoA-transferase CaiB-like acyl-CoA transferase
MPKGLEGIKGIEVGGVAAMPLAGMLLGSWGAEIIHVEPPGRGDLQRYLIGNRLIRGGNPPRYNYLWEHVDRNKKGITLDIGTPAGQKILHKMLASADLFLNNLRPYELEKFNLKHETLAKINPRIISANLTGYGQCGPMKNTGGYDSVAFWARSGIMSLLREGDAPPPVSRPAYGDSTTSISLLAGILAALYIRERTGEGQEVAVSLFNTGLWSMGFDLSACLATGGDSEPIERGGVVNPIRNHYPTKDNRWIMLGMTNSQLYWPIFCRTMARPELENDPKFATHEARGKNGPELVAIIDGVFRSKIFAEWTAILKETKLIWAPVVTPLEATKDEQALANEVFVECPNAERGPMRLLNNPIKLSQTPAEFTMKAPGLGEHTREVLQGLGYTEEAIEDLKKAGVI